jgi:hypothetical protein
VDPAGAMDRIDGDHYLVVVEEVSNYPVVIEMMLNRTLTDKILPDRQGVNFVEQFRTGWGGGELFFLNDP